MKKLIATLALLIISASAYAGSGSAVVPYWAYNGTTVKHSQIYVTNITGATLTVTLTAKHHDGTSFTGYTEEGSLSSGTLAPGKSGYFAIPAGAGSSFGYAVIEWESTGNEQRGLVAHAIVRQEGSSSPNFSNAISVNGAIPF